MKNELIKLDEKDIENKIYEIRGKQVMLDSDLAKIYGAETKYLKRQVKRNIVRFPNDFCFEITKEEYNGLLRCQNVTLNKSEYNNLKVIRNNIFHDRYVVIDKKEIYHSGSSINSAGNGTFSINKLEDDFVIETLLNKIRDIINKM